MPDTLHTVWSTGALLGIRWAACDHRAVPSPAELPTLRRENMTRLRDLRPRCGHCGVRGQLAARLCQLADPDAILVSSAVQDRIRDCLHVTKIGPRHLKGFPKPVDVYGVEWR